MKRPSRHRSLRTSLVATGSTWRAGGGSGPGNGLPGYREKSVVLTSALHEYRRLREQGNSVSVGEFCEKYPDYRKSLLRLIDVEDNLGDLGDIEDPFPEVGEDFLGFEILSDLGVGAIARVYLAAEPELGGRRVVIKVAADGTAEAATLGKLQHPNIVQVYSVKCDADSGMTAVCMPYQGSATLTDVLDLIFRDGRPPLTAAGILDVASRLADMDALRDDDLATSRPDPVLVHGTFVDAVVHIGIQLADALEYAHESGVLHRDLKPSNILLTPHGRPMLLDFNLAFDEDHDAMPRGGTLPYMAPEQIRAGIKGEPSSSQGLDPHPDVFSLGVILYELFTGQLPYGGPPEQLGPEAASLWQLNAHDTKPTPIRSVNPLVPVPIATAIESCLAIDPGQRPESLAQVATALQTHFSRGERIRRWLHHHAAWCRAALVALVLIGSAAGAFFALRPPAHIREYRAALLAYEQQNYDQAIELIGPTIQGHPDFAQAFFLRAMCHEAKSKRKEAAADMQAATKLAPSAAAWDCLGCLSYRVGKMFDAVTCFENAIKLDPNNARLYAKLALATSKTGLNYKLAEEQANKAVQLDSQIAEVYLIRADVYHQQQKSDAVIEDLRRGCEITPHSQWILLEAAEKLCFFAGRNPSAKELIKDYLNRAAELGLSKETISSIKSFDKCKDEPWWAAILAKAQSKSESRKPPLTELMRPSLPAALLLTN